MKLWKKILQIGNKDKFKKNKNKTKIIEIEIRIEKQKIHASLIAKYITE